MIMKNRDEFSETKRKTEAKIRSDFNRFKKINSLEVLTEGGYFLYPVMFAVPAIKWIIGETVVILQGYQEINPQT